MSDSIIGQRGGRAAMLLAWLMAGVTCCGAARAGSFDLGWDTTASYKMVLSYGVSVRTKQPADALINGPIDPLVVPATAQSFQSGQAFT
ncbi:MAG: hypothetical protein OSA97_12490, partial [Nevskia sp.]|nr:hypothetical protein [Nevskia sp.]